MGEGQRNILEEIAAATRKRVAAAKQQRPLEEIKKTALQLAETASNAEFPFYQALRSSEKIAMICEVKKASPSKGLIAPDFPYLQIAKEYEEAGAAAISVLTEPEYFLGSNDYLQEIAAEVHIPVLRKDFIVDAYMIYEAKLLGASAILLICAILSQEELEEYLQLAHSLGLSALIEVHDEEELRRAVASGGKIIGVNNRDLRDFTVDVRNSIRLRSLVADEDIVYVSESGIRTPEDIALLRENRINGVLIGETLMRSKDKAAEIAKLQGN